MGAQDCGSRANTLEQASLPFLTIIDILKVASFGGWSKQAPFPFVLWHHARDEFPSDR